MAYSISLLIVVLNKVIQYSVIYATNFEKHITKTDYLTELATKTSIALFFNSGIQTFLIKVLVPWYNTNLAGAQAQIFSASGLVVNQNYVLI
jgi:hypothetical protein